MLYLPLQLKRVAQHNSLTTYWSKHLPAPLAGEDRLLARERYRTMVKDAFPEWLASDMLDALKTSLIAQRHASPQPSPVARGTPESLPAHTPYSAAWDPQSPEASSDWPGVPGALARIARSGAGNLSFESPAACNAPPISQDRQAPPSDLSGFADYPDNRERRRSVVGLRSPPTERKP